MPMYSYRVAPIDIFHDGWREVEEGKHTKWAIFNHDGVMRDRIFNSKEITEMHCRLINRVMS